jgi:hypothetical protein
MVIGGNHDWVFQSLGREEVQRALEKYCGDSVIYLGIISVFQSRRVRDFFVFFFILFAF